MIRLHRAALIRSALNISLAGMVGYMLIVAVIHVLLVPINTDPQTFYPAADYSDGKRYVKICAQGYDLPVNSALPTIDTALISWMPIYPALQCVVHRFGVSLVYAGTLVSTLAAGVTLFFGTLTLANLGLRARFPYMIAAFLQPIGTAWLFIPGAEATYLAVGTVAMWLITLPGLPDTPRGNQLEAFRSVAAAGIGAILMLTKPNALAMLLPFAFAFFYQSWRRSQAAGYEGGLWAFAADVAIDHLRPLFSLIARLRRARFDLEACPIQYDWTAAAAIGGIGIGLAGWVAYTSWLSGVPFYFLQQQLIVWRRAWPSGNLGEMTLYWLQAFRGATRSTPWRVGSAYYLAANLSGLVPAASNRVPTLIRGMLVLLPVFLLYSGAANGDDRYVLATGLVAVGWACWLAPQAGHPRRRWPVAARLVFMSSLALLTSYFLLYHLFAIGALGAMLVVDR